MPNTTRENIASAVTSIRRIVRALRLSAQRTQAGAGVSAAQMFVLEQLEDGTSLSLNELAARTMTDRTSVAAVVSRLQAQRLVARAVSRTDRRRAAVRITAAGRRLLDRSPESPMTGLIVAMKSLDRRRIAALATSLRELTDAIGATDHPAPFLFSDDRSQPRAKQTAKR